VHRLPALGQAGRVLGVRFPAEPMGFWRSSRGGFFQVEAYSAQGVYCSLRVFEVCFEEGVELASYLLDKGDASPRFLRGWGWGCKGTTLFCVIL
jgi:hypothetical protein